MRVIAGKARGTKLISPEGLETRPTSDRIKESLFNIIAPDLYDSLFLDLFSGSGGIGIEALSRGAQEAVFVDMSKGACESIKTNVEKTRFIHESTMINASIEFALNQLGKENKMFNIIFMDPPYNKDIINDTIELIIKNRLLAPNGYLIVERDSTYKMAHYKELELYKEKKYGITTISFLKGTEDI